MNKRQKIKGPQFIVGCNPLVDDTDYLVVNDKNNLGIIQISGWIVLAGEITPVKLKRAQKWYYGVYLKYLNKL